MSKVTSSQSSRSICIRKCLTYYKRKCILQVMKIPVTVTAHVNTLWDSAATLSLITFKKAEELRLCGDEVNLSITKTGGMTDDIRSSSYKLTLKDKEGENATITVYGVPKISNSICHIRVGELSMLFQDLNETEVMRPTGEVDVLIGLDYASFHPQLVANVDHLVLYQNRFGKCLGGMHSNVEEGTRKIVVNATVNHFNAETMSEFFTNEDIGVDCRPILCGSCRCGKCPLGGKPYSIKEERELHLIKEGLKLEDNKWTATYPWKRSPKDLPDNSCVAAALLFSTERRLMKNPDLAVLYQQEIDKMLENKFARVVDKKELAEYDGPVHYICHHEVCKPGSGSTPLRIVFNASKNFHGHILNDYWVKGPDLINNMMGVLLRFRENCVAMCGDIRKMYHTIHLSLLDQHTHRFFWRNLNLNSKPSIYVMNVVSFGDRPAGAITMTALSQTAELCETQYPAACETILRNIYVDDILDSVADKEKAELLTQEIDEVLSKGSFKVKQWTFSESNATQVNLSQSTHTRDNTEVQKVLGMSWDPTSDKFFFNIKLNFSPKVKGVRKGADLTESDVPLKVPLQLTKRDILSQINGLFDPMGLLTAFTVKAKILWRNLWIGECKSIGWDGCITEKQRKDWIGFFKEMFEIECIEFNRCIKPADASDKQPVLVLFSDGSINAFGTCAYIRWELNDGRFVSNLIAARSKICPIKSISTVRIEMNGAVLSKRLHAFIVRETRIQFHKVYFLVDSQIVYSMIQRESYGFSTFIGLRVGEIQRSTKPSSWFWIDRNVNIADWVTKGRRPSDLHEGSVWQNGLSFLQTPESDWPIYQRTTTEIPELTRSVMVTIKEPEQLAERIQLSRFSNYHKLIRTTARILSIYQGKPRPSLYNALQSPSRSDYDLAVMFWILYLQSPFTEEDMRNRYKTLSPQRREDGVWIVGSRAAKWIEFSYNNKNVVLLPADTVFTKLYARHIHNISHCGVAATVSKIRLRFWIVRVAIIVKSIIHKCATCRRNRELNNSQIMGDLPIERLLPSPPWTYISLDYFGPYQVRGEITKRSRGKVFGIIFTCVTTRAVHLDVACSYSTDSFLKVLRRYVSIRGYPSKIYSDNGSQLVGASRELKKWVKDLDWDILSSYGADRGMLWEFTSADAPWQNGCSEALIKSCKKSISYAIGVNTLNFSEMQTVLFEVANILNERPIGRHPTSPDDGAYLCPNDILLGRATSRVPQGPFKEYSGIRQRFELVQTISNTFWRKMTRDFFQSLIIRKRWHVHKRNICAGDVVIVQDSNAVRGEWRIAKVSKVYPDERGTVRNCEVQYKKRMPGNKFENNFTTLKRAVQKLIVLVPVEDDSVES